MATVLILLLPLCVLISAVSLVLRDKRSGEEVREQIKWVAFAASFVGVVYLGDETDLDSLNAELITVVRETMQPEHASLWLRPNKASSERRR